MKKYFIPIIGTISSGKTTFLKGFLGIDFLETGSTTTTKFICLIKNSDKYLFYHVLPSKKDTIISFIKDGEVCKGEEKIKEKMKEINQNISKINNKESLNKIFYMLEVPIKNIDNEFILQNSYFMDIPGLNEIEQNYIEDVFNLINLNDILFEIIIFDSSNIGSDNILNILISLEKKNVLKKENNLFILNKIDLRSKKEDIIDTFKNYFYRNLGEGQNKSDENEEIEENKEDEIIEENDIIKENKKNGDNSGDNNGDTNLKSKKNMIQINIYKNKLIPMNSLLYLCETKLNDDFNSLLVFESYNYLSNYKSKFLSFYDFIKKKLEFLKHIENIDINKESKKIEGNLGQIIKSSIDFLKLRFKNNQDMNLGFSKKSDKEIKKMDIIYKIKKYPIEFSDSYKQLQEFIKSIKNENKENIIENEIQGYRVGKKLEYKINSENNNQQKFIFLSLVNKNNNLLINIKFENVSQEYFREFTIEELIKFNKFFQLFDNMDKIIEGLKEIFDNNLPKITEINGVMQLTFAPMTVLGEITLKIPKKIPNNIDIIERLDKFLVKTFEEIDPEKELKTFRISLQTLRENILGRKIRISLIGSISVGKSTVLNCIIGEELLPTKDEECTYRGVILRFKDDEEFKLYETKLISKGKGKDEYYFFEENKNPHCKGIKNIKDYLTNKNNDNKISDEDAYILITGKLKIFEYLKLEENIINKIEFIDLPGNDREGNEFNSKQYYKKILKFSNCCIYMNVPENIDSQTNVDKMMAQYTEDKFKVFPVLRINFIKTCIFLINKSDLIEDEKDRKKIIQILIDNIKYKEPNIVNNEINVSFFSGISFNYFLNVQKNFIYLLENNPIQLFRNLYKKWCDTLEIIGFKDFIIYRIVSDIEQKFDLEQKEEEEEAEEDEIEIPEDFKNQLKNALKVVIKNLETVDENEIIQSLYRLYDNIKKKDFDETIYSKKFFYKLNETIIFSDNLQEINKQFSIKDFLSFSDLLFSKKINQENKEEVEKLSSQYSKIQSMFIVEKGKLKDMINLGRDRCYQAIMDEINNCDNKKIDDIEKSRKDLEKKINDITQEIIKKEQNIRITLAEEMNKIKIQSLNNLILKNEQANIVIDAEDPNILPSKGVIGVSSLLSAGIGMPASVAVDAAIVNAYGGVYIGTTAFAVDSLLSSFSLIGIALSIPILAYLGYNYFHKSERYKETLKNLKSTITDYYYNYNLRFEEEFKSFEEDINKEKNQMLEIQKKDIKNIDENKWKKRKEEYLELKADIMNAIENNNLVIQKK